MAAYDACQLYLIQPVVHSYTVSIIILTTGKCNNNSDDNDANNMHTYVDSHTVHDYVFSRVDRKRE